MNQHLQTLLDYVQRSETLSSEEKDALVASLKAVDKELEITAFKLDRTEKVKRATAILLEETIEELEQKRKAVEAQNRELEIEGALEKVRTIVLREPGYHFRQAQHRWIENLTAQCESMAMDGPIGLIVIGHIGRCKTQKKAENKNILLGLISEEISDLAKNLNVPILVLCQLNREIEKRPIKDQYPRLSDIRESGRIEENADNVVGLYRQNRESEDVRLEWLKGRDVGTFVTCLKFDRLIQKFRESDNRPEDTQEERKRREW